MALQERSDNWLRKHVLILNDSIQCNICDKVYKINPESRNRTIKIIKGHLYHEHKKYDEKDRLEWENNNDLIWQYFDKTNLYTAECKFCGRCIHRSYLPSIRWHLQNHLQEIRASIKKKIADKSLWQYFEIYEEKFSAWCKRCDVKLDIFYGTDVLINHICSKRNKSLRSRQEPEDKPDVNRMTQQSVVDENTNSSFYHDNLNKAFGNRENQQSNTSRYCTKISSTGVKRSNLAERSYNHWMWKYVSKLNKFTIKCNNCDKIYYNKCGIHLYQFILSIKVHLYYKHKIWNEKDRLKWENNNNLIWQYCDKVDLFKGKCKFCEYLCLGRKVGSLKLHLERKHSQEIRAIVQKEIANKSLSQYFEVCEENFTFARCKRCHDVLDIFYGTDALIHHICFKKDNSLRSRQEPGDNDVNRMAQQSIVIENANISFHRDDINRQDPRNQDQQSNTEINDLRSHCQYHINENSKYEKEAADNSEYIMMQHDVAAENMNTRYYYGSTYWHNLENQEGQQRNDNGIDIESTSIDGRFDAFDVESTSSFLTGSEENYINNIVSHAHDVSDVSSRHDDTNWQTFGYQVNQQRMMHQLVAAENMATNSYNDDTTLQALGNQENQ